MTTERMLELLILKIILKDYDDHPKYKEVIDRYFNIFEIEKRYEELGDEFLKPYAIDIAEKSE